MRILCVLALCGVTVSVTGCGGGGKSVTLSKGEYRAALAKIAKEADTMHSTIERQELASTTVAEAVSTLRTFAERESAIGDEVAKLEPPSDAVAANTLLAKGEHDDAKTILGLLPRLSNFTKIQDLFAYLRKTPQPKGGIEQDRALTRLHDLGYAKGS
jgi:hypothetical protein